MSAMVQQNKKYSTLLIENQYFPSVTYINTLFQFTNIKIEQYETFQKMSFRNRCMIAGSNGVIDLSVPLENGRNQHQQIKEVKIANTANWQRQHLRTLESCYGRSPFFEYYRDEISRLLLKNNNYLLDLNLAILEWLKILLKFEGHLALTTEYVSCVEEGTLDRRNYFLPKKRIQQQVLIKYSQVFEDRLGFESNLSILDLLCCEGPNARELLRDNKLTF